MSVRRRQTRGKQWREIITLNTTGWTITITKSRLIPIEKVMKVAHEIVGRRFEVGGGSVVVVVVEIVERQRREDVIQVVGGGKERMFQIMAGREGIEGAETAVA